MKPVLLVLAAGIGSRYGGLKQIDAVGPSGEAIIDYSIYDAIRAGFGKVVFVIRKSIEKDIRDFFEPRLKGRINFDFVYQELDMIPSDIKVPDNRTKPWGTAHAVLCAREVINEPFAVINGDDFYGPSSYQQLVEFLNNNTHPDEYAMVGYRLEKTLSPHGSVARGVCSVSGDGNLMEITEHTKIFIRGEEIVSAFSDGSEKVFSGDEIVSMNFWGFKPNVFARFDRLFREFLYDHGREQNAEFFIPTPLSVLIRTNRIRLKVIQSQENWFGVTYKDDKPQVIERINDLIINGIYPDRLW